MPTKVNANGVIVSDPQSFAGSAPARFLNADFRVNVLRTNALLQPYEWQEIDTAVIEVARAQLNGIADLRQYGLIHQLGGLGTLISAYTQQGDMTGADVDMSGVVEGERDRVDYTTVYTPVPIVHKDFRLDIRTLQASRRMGDGLDVTQPQTATRKVTEKLEDILFNGCSIKVNANAIYGYTTHPSRNTTSATGDFGTLSSIYPTITDMVTAAEADYYYGPYGLYVSPTQYGQMRAVYTDGSGQSAMSRIMTNLPQVKFIKPSANLVDGSLVLVSLVRDCVDLAVAQDIVPLEWSEMGGMVQNFKIMGCMVPRIKSDAEGRSGIVHCTGA